MDNGQHSDIEARARPPRVPNMLTLVFGTRLSPMLKQAEAVVIRASSSGCRVFLLMFVDR
jgi:hypothetical protein